MRVSFLSVPLVAIALPLTPLEVRAQAGEAHQVQVAAGQGDWTMTGITVDANDLVVIFATGAVMVGGMSGMVNADGWTTSGRPKATGVGYLEAKIGDGDPFPAGSRFVFIAEQNGPLKLAVSNASAHSSGWFTVTVFHFPAHVLPPVLPFSPED